MNKLAIVAAAALAATTFGLSGAFAQSNDDAFAKADTNTDKSVSMDEAMAVYPTLTQDIFAKADANGDGKLDEGEYTSLVGLSANLAGGTGAAGGNGGSSSSSAAQ